MWRACGADHLWRMLARASMRQEFMVRASMCFMWRKPGACWRDSMRQEFAGARHKFLAHAGARHKRAT